MIKRTVAEGYTVIPVTYAYIVKSLEDRQYVREEEEKKVVEVGGKDDQESSKEATADEARRRREFEVY